MVIREATRLGDRTRVRSFSCPVSIRQMQLWDHKFLWSNRLGSPREQKPTTDVILRRAEKHVQNSVFRELFCYRNCNVLQINILGKNKKTQTMENFTGFALKVQSKNCTEMEKLIENKLSREQMPTIYHSRHEKWCRGASMTKQKGMEAIENKKAFFKSWRKWKRL